MDAMNNTEKTRLLAPFLRQYAYRRVPAKGGDTVPWWHIIVETLDDRRFWRLIITNGTPEEWLIRDAEFGIEFNDPDHFMSQLASPAWKGGV